METTAHPAGSIIIVFSLFIILWLALAQVRWLVRQIKEEALISSTYSWRDIGSPYIMKCVWKDGARIMCVYLLYLILILSFPGELSLFCWANFPLCFSHSYRERGAAMVSLCIYFYFKTVAWESHRMQRLFFLSIHKNSNHRVVMLVHLEMLSFPVCGYCAWDLFDPQYLRPKDSQVPKIEGPNPQGGEMTLKPDKTAKTLPQRSATNKKRMSDNKRMTGAPACFNMANK